MIAKTVTAWIQLLDAARKLLVGVVVFGIFAIAIAAGGRYMLGDDSRLGAVSAPRSKPAAPAIPWDKVDRDVAQALEASRFEAAEAAEAKLDVWRDGLIERIDNDFLDWYFGYWTQQVLGIQSLWYAGVERVLSDQPSAAERITETIQEEFATRVLRPQIAQLELEHMTREVMDAYVADLRGRLGEIPDRYRIPEADWDRYLTDVSILTQGVEGGRQVELSLKAVTATGAGGAVVLGSTLTRYTARLGQRTVGAQAGRAASGMAARTGGKVAARAGGKMLGPIVGVGVIAWDVWDHHRTEKVNRPLLRESLVDYIEQMNRTLLHDTEEGMLAIVYDMEAGLIQSMDTAAAKRDAGSGAAARAT